MNRPLLPLALAAGAVFGFVAPARADTGVTEFCHDALEAAAAAKRSVEGLVAALQDAVDRVNETNPEDRDATLERAKAGVHGLRAAAAQQLQTSADTIEEDEPDGLPDDSQERADRLVQGQRDLSDTILYKEYPALGPGVDNLNQASIDFFSECPTAR